MGKNKFLTGMVFTLIILGVVNGFSILAFSNQSTTLALPGETWTTPQNITLVDKQAFISNNNFRNILVDDAGNIHVVYYGFSDNTESNREIYYATNSSGVWSWANISRVNYSGVWQSDPVIALDSNGILHVVWTGLYPGATDKELFYANNSGGVWSTPYNVTKTVSGDESYPALVIDSQNNLHIVYVDYDAFMLKYVNRTSIGSWSTPIDLLNPPYIFTNELTRPTIAVDSNDNLFVAFSGNNATYNNEIYLINNTAGDWSIPYNVTRDSLTDDWDDDLPYITIDSQDRIHLAWLTTNFTVYGLEYQSYVDNVWSTPVYITLSDEQIYGFSMYPDFNNELHLCYDIDTGGGFCDIYYVNNTGGVWHTPAVVSNHTANELNPNIVVDNHGYAHIVFSSSDIYFHVKYVRSTIPVAYQIPLSEDYTLIILASVIVAVIVVAVAVYMLKIRK